MCIVLFTLVGVVWPCVRSIFLLETPGNDLLFRFLIYFLGFVALIDRSFLLPLCAMYDLPCLKRYSSS